MTKRKDTQPAESAPAGPAAESGVALYGRFFPAKLPGMEGVKTTIVADSDKGRADIMAAASPSTLEIGEEGFVRFVCTDVTVFWDEQEDEETGEIKQFVRTCFHTKDGGTFRTTSQFAPHFAARLLDLYGLQRLKDGIPIIVKERRSRREKRVYHDFRVEYATTGEPKEDGERETPF